MPFIIKSPVVSSWQNWHEETEEAKEARKTFWSLVDGAHEDQIYLHIGHVNMEKGIFDLAGKDR